MDKTVSRFLMCFVAVVVFAWPATVQGFPTYDNGSGTGCVQCHNGFTDRGPLHDLHDDMRQGGGAACNLCHPSGAGSTPVRTTSSDDGGTLDGPGYGCRGCHGRSQDDVGSGFGTWAAGLRRIHDGFGCSGCHSNDPPTVEPETTAPPYYDDTIYPVTVTNPCTEENFGGSLAGGPGLDNDGNGDTDLADTACITIPVEVSTWGNIKSLYRGSTN